MSPASVDARTHNSEHLVRMNASRAVSDESPPTRVSDEINPSRPSGVGGRGYNAVVVRCNRAVDRSIRRHRVHCCGTNQSVNPFGELTIHPLLAP
jgi:hypothetical protein